jgi:hypothetical protein
MLYFFHGKRVAFSLTRSRRKGMYQALRSSVPFDAV